MGACATKPKADKGNNAPTAREIEPRAPETVAETKEAAKEPAKEYPVEEARINASTAVEDEKKPETVETEETEHLKTQTVIEEAKAEVATAQKTGKENQVVTEQDADKVEDESTEAVTATAVVENKTAGTEAEATVAGT